MLTCIDAVDDEAAEQGQHKYWVTFPDYGNSESVDLGDIELPAAAGAADGAANSSSRDRRSGSHDDDDRGRGGRGGGDEGEDRGGGRDRRRRSSSRDRHRDSRRRDSRDRSRSRSRSRDRESSKRPAAEENLLQRVLQDERNASAAVGRNYGQRPASYKGSLSLKQDRFTVRRRSPTPPSRRHDSSRGRSNWRRSPSRSPPRAERHRDGAERIDNSEQIRRMQALKEKYGDASAAK